MTPKLNCVDMSKWGGELTAAEVACMRDEHGVRRVIVGTGGGSLGQWSRQQADAAIQGGLDLDAYVYLYMDRNPESQIRAALDVMRDIEVQRWWLDAEDTQSPQLNFGNRATFLARCIEYLAQQGLTEVGIYTGRWWWVPNMGNSNEFAHLPLWNSWYDNNPDTDGLPYGGWTDSTIEQYQGTTDLCGHSVDLNYDKTYSIIIPDPEGEMADPEARARIDRLNEVMVKRERLRRLASDPDAKTVENAIRVLEEGGIAV